MAPLNDSICSHSVPVEMTEDNYYNCTCPAGHEMHIVLRNQKFELLFESAALAVLDGYNREAISGFSSSLERFYEFYVQVIVHKNMIFGDSFTKTWKILSRQSERQLGAFLMTYLLENKTDYMGLDEKMVAFRNSVVHKGYLPTSDETSLYAEFVMRAIYTLIEELYAKYPDALRDVAQKNSDKAAGKVVQAAANNTVRSPNLIVSTILSIAAGGQPSTVAQPFSEALKGLQFIRSKLYTP